MNKNFLEWLKTGVAPEKPVGSIAERYNPRPPEPVPATKMLRTQLERVTLAYNDRERVLVVEIAAREAELADIRQAREAAMSALVELEPFPDLVVTDEAPEPMTGDVFTFRPMAVDEWELEGRN